MASKHLGFEDLSSDLEYTVVVNSENDFNVNSKEERIKDEPVENEPSSEFVCDYIYLERVQDEKWCTPEFVKLEELQTEDVDDNLNWKTENAELIDSKSETGKETPNEDKFEEEGTGVKTASEKVSGSSGEKIFQCNTCLKTFTRKAVLAVHQKIHTGETTEQCKFCAKHLLKKSLARHEITHTGEKPFSCSTCSKSFIRKCGLVHHERLHSGEKPFSCSFCSKLFSRKSCLIPHERIHTGEKPYQCGVCYQSFANKGNLNLHEKLHSAEDRPFSCKLCLMSFNFKSNLTRHEKLHTTRKTSYCKFCLDSLKRQEENHKQEDDFRSRLCTYKKCYTNLTAKYISNPVKHFEHHIPVLKPHKVYEPSRRIIQTHTNNDG